MINDVHKIDDLIVSKPLNSSRLTIDAVFEENTIAEVQPSLSSNALTWGTSGKDRILQQINQKGRYKKIYYEYTYNGVRYLRAFLDEINYKLDKDQIETTLSIDGDTNTLAGLLAAVNSSVLINDYRYTDIEVMRQKIDYSIELIQLGFSTLTYLYLLYNQILELQKAISDLTEATTPIPSIPPTINLGAIISAAIKVAARVIFFAATLIALINNFIQLKELLLPRVRIGKALSLYELIRAPLSLLGYNIETNLDEMFNTYYLSQGELDRSDWAPRIGEPVYTGQGALEFVLKKFNAKVRIIDKTLFIYQEFDDFFFKQTNYTIPTYFRDNYEENTDDVKGFRQIKYSTDSTDRYTEINYKGSDFVVITRPKGNRQEVRTESTIKGADIIEMGVGLCTRKDSLSVLEKAWLSFVSIANTVISAFNGGNQAINVSSRIGAAIFDEERISTPRLLKIEDKKIPVNHRSVLSAKSDYEKYYSTKSLVTNKRARYRIYRGSNAQLVRFVENDLTKIISNGYITDLEGRRGKVINNLKWEADRDNTVLEFKIEDTERTSEDTLEEEFIEPNFI